MSSYESDARIRRDVLSEYSSEMYSALKNIVSIHPDDTYDLTGEIRLARDLLARIDKDLE